MKSGHTATAHEGQIAFTNDILKKKLNYLIMPIVLQIAAYTLVKILISQINVYVHCCHENNIPRSQCVVFKDSKYDMSSEFVQNTLSTRFAIASCKEYICRSCHNSLLLGKKHHKRPHKNQSVGHNCILCCSASDNKSRPFQLTTYGRNDMLADILHGKNFLAGAIMCFRCHNKLIQNMFVSCCICKNVVKWKSTLNIQKVTILH